MIILLEGDRNYHMIQDLIYTRHHNICYYSFSTLPEMLCDIRKYLPFVDEVRKM